MPKIVWIALGVFLAACLLVPGFMNVAFNWARDVIIAVFHAK